MCTVKNAILSIFSLVFCEGDGEVPAQESALHETCCHKLIFQISNSCVVHTIMKCISDCKLGHKIFFFTRKDHSEYVRSLKEYFSPIMSLDGPYFHLPCYKKGLTSFYSSSLCHLYCKERYNIRNLIESMKAVRCGCF